MHNSHLTWLGLQAWFNPVAAFWLNIDRTPGRQARLEVGCAPGREECSMHGRVEAHASLSTTGYNLGAALAVWGEAPDPGRSPRLCNYA